MPSYCVGHPYWATKKVWRYPDRPIPDRLKHIYALNLKPEKRVHDGY